MDDSYGSPEPVPRPDAAPQPTGTPAEPETDGPGVTPQPLSPSRTRDPDDDGWLPV